LQRSLQLATSTIRSLQQALQLATSTIRSLQQAFRLRLSAYLHFMLGVAAVQLRLATGAGVDDESHHSFCAFPLFQSK
jgi:hypothetical protein